MLTLLSLLKIFLNGFRVLADDIVALAKTRTDRFGTSLFGSVIAGAQRRTKTVAHSIIATFIVCRVQTT